MLFAAAALFACAAVGPLAPWARAADLGAAAGAPITTPESPGDTGTLPPSGQDPPQATPAPDPPPPPPSDPPPGEQGQGTPAPEAGATVPPGDEQGARSGPEGTSSPVDARHESSPDSSGAAPRADAPAGPGSSDAGTGAPAPLPLDDVQVEVDLDGQTGGTTLASTSPQCVGRCHAGSVQLAGVLVRAASANRLEQHNRVIRETRASTLSRIAVARAPDGYNNPFFRLFGGGGGAPAAVLLMGFLAVLATTSLRAPAGMRPFLASAVTWRPPAYVPPIESPG